jgi:peptide/nickel transport system substrate-binding protein
MRAAPDGTPLAFEMIMISGWNDAVAASEVIVQNLQDIGIKAELKTGDWGFWSDKITKGEYDLSLGYTSAGATPYAFYRGQMASDVVQPVGEVIWENWSRYTNPEADALLKQFAQTADQSEQVAIAKQLQQIYATELPSLPLFPAPDWYEYNTSRFTGWPSAENPYANGAVYKQDRLIVMTTVEPVR